MRYCERQQNGQSVIEIVLAAALFVIVAIPLSGVLIQSMQTGALGGDETAATQYAAEGLEAIRDIRNQSFSLLTTSPGEGVAAASGTWSVSGASSTFEKFTRVITVTSTYRDGSGNIVATGGTLDPNTMKIISTVIWGISHSVALSTYLTNWRANFAAVGPYVVATSTYAPADAGMYYDSEPNNIQRASDGGLIVFFENAASPVSLAYVTSTNGSVWSAPILIDNGGYGDMLFSSYMDASNNVYIAYGMDYSPHLALNEIKFTYNGSGSWSRGTTNTIDTNPGVKENPSIIMDNSGTIWVAYEKLMATSTYAVVISTSTISGTTWSAPTIVSATTTAQEFPALTLYNKQYPLVAYNGAGGNQYINTQFYNGSSWSNPIAVDSSQAVNEGFHLTSIGNNVMYVGARNTYGLLEYSIFSGSTQTWSTLTAISPSALDTYYSNIVTDGTNAWTLYGHYNGTANNYDIYERKWNGTSWFVNGTSLTTTGNNNEYPQVPQTIAPGSTSTIPYVYMSGTSSPYTIYYNSFAPTETQIAQVVTSTGAGSWTVPAGVTSVQIQLWGGGGGGTGNYFYNGGAGAGAYLSQANVPVTPGSTINFIIGAGGTGGNATSSGGVGGSGYQSGGNGTVSSLYSSGGGGGSSCVNIGGTACGTGGTTYIASAGGGSAGAGTAGNSANGSSGGAGGSGGYQNANAAGGGGGSGSVGGNGNSSTGTAGVGGTGGTTQTGTNGAAGSSYAAPSSAGASGNGNTPSNYSTTGAAGSGGAAGGAGGTTGGNGTSVTNGDSGGGGGTGSTGHGGNGGQPGGGAGAGETNGGAGGTGELIITYTHS